MPFNYTPANAVTVVREMTKNIPYTAIDSQTCDMINSIMWNFYPFSWTINSLTAVSVTDGNQDVGSAPADFDHLLRARLVRTDLTPDEFHELNIVTWLAPDLSEVGYQQITSICYEEAENEFRFDRAVDVGTGMTIQLQGEYKNTPTRITDSNLTTAFLFPDHYFQVFVEGLLWQAYRYADDPRAGTTQTMRNGQRSYTGQLGIFMDLLFQMAADQDYGAGSMMHPETPLGVSYPAGPEF